MRRPLLHLLLACVLSLLAASGFGREAQDPSLAPRAATLQGLPPEAIATLRLIQDGGPFPYRKDGTVFQNREGRLPVRPWGYYREYTVTTPDSPDRGARRIIAGGTPPRVFYYTHDHYRSFRPIEVRP